MIEPQELTAAGCWAGAGVTLNLTRNCENIFVTTSPAQPRVAPVTWRQVLDKHIVLHSPLAQALRGFHPKFVFNIFVVHSFGNMPNLDY